MQNRILKLKNYLSELQKDFKELKNKVLRETEKKISNHLTYL